MCVCVCVCVCACMCVCVCVCVGGGGEGRGVGVSHRVGYFLTLSCETCLSIIFFFRVICFYGSLVLREILF